MFFFNYALFYILKGLLEFSNTVDEHFLFSCMHYGYRYRGCCRSLNLLWEEITRTRDIVKHNEITVGMCKKMCGTMIVSVTNWINHYTDIIMGTIASQITSLVIVYSTVYSGEYQRKHQSSASLAFVRGIHR